MNTFSISLAGIPIEVQANYLKTKDFCEGFLTDEKCLFSVTVSANDIEHEKIVTHNVVNIRKSADSHPTSTYEITALFRKIVSELLIYDVILFHSSVVAFGGKAYLFAAPSGTGKTTHAKLWLKEIPNCHILNGDKPLLLFKRGKVYACGTPWRGKEKLGINEILPVGGIAILNRAEENSVEKISINEALNELLSQIYVPESKDSLLNIMKLVLELKNVPLFRLHCNMEREAAQVSFRGMVV